MKKLATKNQNENLRKGVERAKRKRVKKGRANRIKMDPNMAITPSVLLGMARRIA